MNASSAETTGSADAQAENAGMTSDSIVKHLLRGKWAKLAYEAVCMFACFFFNHPES
jgi:hypothetical protein